VTHDVATFYNDTDAQCAAWLRELVKGGHIADGTVDERSIADLRPADLDGFRQVHLFAGIGGWSFALRLAGWPDDRPIWTGSCPCQPFSAAGKRLGTADKRHLWPEMRRLIAECRPATVFGEQVASRAGREWLAGVRADLEALGYAVGAADLCAAGLGAPHIRQRLYWCAGRLEHSAGERFPWGNAPIESGSRNGVQAPASGHGTACGLADATMFRCARHPNEGGCAGTTTDKGGLRESARSSADGGLGNAESGGRGEFWDASLAGSGGYAIGADWSRYDLIPCRDGKTRRVESGTFPLVAKLPVGVVPSGDPGRAETQATAEARVMRLRGYGNAIIPPLAAAFIRAYLETER